MDYCGSNGEWNASGVADICTKTNSTMTGTILTLIKHYHIFYSSLETETISTESVSLFLHFVWNTLEQNI